MVVKVMYVDRSADEDKPLAVSQAASWALLLTAVGVVLLGVVAAPVYNWALRAGQELLF